MKTCLAVSVALVVLAVPVTMGVTSAQGRGVAPEAAERFEVATVKQNKSGEIGPRFSGRPGRFSVKSATLQEIIMYAYELQAFEIFGGPGWVTNDRFDIDATMEPAPTGSASGPRQRRLLRALLAERFTLIVHEERREMPVYAMVLARPDRKLGERLRPFDGDCAKGAAAPLAPELSALRPEANRAKDPTPCMMGLIPGRISGRGMMVSNLTDTLSTLPPVRRRVIDRTGLTGQFDFDLEWTPMATSSAPAAAGVPNAPSDAVPNVFTALQEQLGLKLESTKEAIPVLVIDSVNQPSQD